ncbi:hypothetical protein [Tenacibaculum piscium]|uniref:hypothetical protein n=1 Tax=Tenacibaculum piscium TaxID=1458515 RepID=UPI0018E9E83D|nr:hypothetical protein [Tenacibaculum piscium]
MARIIKKKKQDIGLSPDELIFRGEQKTEEILFRVIDFDAQNLTENTTKKVKDLSELQHSDSVTWLNLDGLHNMAVMQEISSVFKFSPLVMGGGFKYRRKT